MVNVNVPATGEPLLKDSLEGGTVFPSGGMTFGPAGGLERVTGGNPLPVVQIGTLMASGAFSMDGPLPAGSNNIGDVDVASVPDRLIPVRAPNPAEVLHVAFAAASTAEAALPTLNASREAILVATDFCYLRIGAAGVGAASAANTSMLIPPGIYVMPLPAGTHARVIRATADGVLQIIAVA